ncbi:MAG: ankyrin repeat domain-containing protein [Alphaproteobacteria bacterium]
MVLAAATAMFATVAAAQAAAPWAPPQPSGLDDVLSLLQQSLATVGDEINAGGQSPNHLENSAAAGDADAQFRLAVHYRLGLGVDRDPAMAIAWYRKASEKRLVTAQLHLGAMLINGEGGDLAPAEALSWWLVAARGGNPLAVAGARFLGAQLSFLEQTDARKMAERMIGVWTSFEHWAAADSGGALDIDLVAAADAGNLAAIKRLIDSGVSPDAINQHGRPALLAAAIGGHDGIAEALLRRGANANAIDGSGKALLMGAADAGSEAVTKLLLRHGAMVNAVDRHGRAALSTAAWRGYGAVVDALLAVGADPNLRPTDGASALMGAAVNGYAAVAGRLLANGVAINDADKDGFTALIRAAWNGHGENGARIDAESKNGKPPYALRTATAILISSKCCARPVRCGNQYA